MTLSECKYETVKPYAGRAARDHVSVSDTRNTLWFTYGDNGSVAGICGLLLLANGSARVKGVWVEPQQRGRGTGTAMTEALIATAKQRGTTRLECCAYNATFYESNGGG